jgi:hypothetical protein
MARSAWIALANCSSLSKLLRNVGLPLRCPLSAVSMSRFGQRLIAQRAARSNVIVQAWLAVHRRAQLVEAWQPPRSKHASLDLPVKALGEASLPQRAERSKGRPHVPIAQPVRLWPPDSGEIQMTTSSVNRDFIAYVSVKENTSNNHYPNASHMRSRPAT